MMNNNTQLPVMAIALTTLLSCTSVVSEFVGADGAPRGEVIFPDLEDATLPEGIFPNLENLSSIDSGVTKKDLYHLIERPHFHEMNGAKEWDYIMKFRQPDRSVKICQYKVLFDKDNIARNFYWKPAGCLNETMDLSADALFLFDRGAVSDIKPAGKTKLQAIAKQIVAEGNKPRLHVIGYTDYLGNDSYNQALSEQRAYSVREYLISQGVAAEHIRAEGRGESSPVMQCNPQSQATLIACLAPNRRVNVTITRH